MNRAMRFGMVAALAAGAAGLMWSCASESKSNATATASSAMSGHAHGSVQPPTMADQAPRDYAGVHNVVAFGPGVYSGSLPEEEPGFRSLKAMGIRTIISVDGAAPEVKLAEAEGMRYVHLPIGYNGMSEERTLEIARAVRDLEGPVYIHCHHGKHRSAAAAGAAAVSLGLLDNAEATARMKVSGTSPRYAGLYGCVAAAKQASDDELDHASDDFPEVWRTTGLVQGMVEIDHAWGRLKAIQQAGWSVPVDHPDLVPVAEAGRLADVFRHLMDDDEVLAKPADFIAWMKRNGREASVLEQAMIDGAPAAELDAHFGAIAATCSDCHAKYRNTPSW